MSRFSHAHRLDRPIGEGDHTQGNPDARVSLVLYGDYQCPYTARVVPIVNDLLRERGEEIHFAYRHFPLSDIHPHSQAASEAAEAAASQGKFWEMHETIFQHMGRQDRSSLLRYAGDLGLDTDRFTQDLKDHAHADRVNRDKESGEQSGVESTPTFYVNGIRYDGENEMDAITEAVRNPPA